MITESLLCNRSVRLRSTCCTDRGDRSIRHPSLEVRSPTGIGDDKLAVVDAVRKLLEGLCDLREGFRERTAPAGQEGRFRAIFPEHCPEAIVLQLEEPTVTSDRLCTDERVAQISRFDGYMEGTSRRQARPACWAELLS